MKKETEIHFSLFLLQRKSDISVKISNCKKFSNISNFAIGSAKGQFPPMCMYEAVRQKTHLNEMTTKLERSDSLMYVN